MGTRRKKTTVDPEIGHNEKLEQLFERWDFVAHVHRTFENTIKAAIYTVLSEGWKYRDCSVDVDDIYQNVLIGPVFKLAEKLQRPGTATLKRRLYKLAEKHTKDYPMKKTMRRGAIMERIVRESPGLIQVEVAPPEEMSSEAA